MRCLVAAPPVLVCVCYVIVLASASNTSTSITTAAVLDDDDAYHTGADRCQAVYLFHKKVNAIQYAQSASGLLALLGCLAVLLVIVGTRKDVGSLAYRVLIGVFTSNAVFAISDIVPKYARFLEGPDCRHFIVGARYTNIAGRCLPEGAMLFGLYTSVSFELLMVIFSIIALKKGTVHVISRTQEIGSYFACVAVGVIAFTGFYLKCQSIHLQQAAIVASSPDGTPGGLSDLQYFELGSLGKSGRASQGDLIGISAGLVILALVLYAYQRYTYHQLLVDLRAAATQAELYDTKRLIESAGADMRTLDRRQKLFQIQKENYDEVARPLEPFFVVFVVFAVMQLVMATRDCQFQSHRTSQEAQDNPPPPCEIVAGMVLSFRATFLALVFFWIREHREALSNFRKLFQRFRLRLWRSMTRCCYQSPESNNASRVRFTEDTVSFDTSDDDMETLGISGDGEPRRNSKFLQADRDIKLLGPMALERLLELDEESERESVQSASTHDLDNSSTVPYRLLQD